VLVLGGTAQALIEIGSISALLHMTYGQLVLVKVGILAVILLFAAGARRLVQRHAGIAMVGAEVRDEPVAVGAAAMAGGSGGRSLAPVRSGTDLGGTDGGDFNADDLNADDLNGADLNGADLNGADLNDADDSDEPYPDDFDADDAPAEPVGMFAPQAKRLRRSVIVELALAVAVLVATSILVQSSPAQNAAGVTTNSQGLLSLTSPLYTLQVEFLPSGSGTDIHMFAYNPAGGPQVVQAWTVVATLPSQNLSENLGVSKITDTHATTTAVLPVPGEWTFTFTLQTTAIDEASVHTTVNIS